MDEKARTGDRSNASSAKGLSEQRPAGMGRLGNLPLHPFLFVAVSVFSLYASNLREVSFSDATAALAAGLGAALVLFLVFGAALRSFGTRAAVLASITIVASLFYVKLIASARGIVGVDLSLAAALPIMLAAMVGLVLVVARLRVDLTLANAVLNGIALALFVTPAWQVASHEWKTGGSSSFTAEAFDQTRSELGERFLMVDAATLKKAPDIYYFIFDRYGSQSTLAKHYAFDNSDLTKFLKEKGFYVASNSHSNYLKTAHSLASTFHMDYLDSLAEDAGSTTEWHPIYDMLKDHRVARFLKSVGYSFIQIGSWWGPTQYNPYTNENYSFGFSEFDYQYLQRTIIPPILNAVAPNSSYAQRLQRGYGQ